MKIHIPELISGRISEILEKTPELVARLASQYSQDAFARKAFDGNPWQQPSDPRRRGSELVRSGNLRGSMRVKIYPDRVTISFGDQRVGYAQVHNEGFDGEVVVPAHTRRTRRGEHQVREHTRHMRIPQRQYVGPAEELDRQIQEQIEALANELLNR